MENNNSPDEIKRLDSLQIFRGLAALSVVFFHTAGGVNFFVQKIPDWLNAILMHGFLGVDFFFILSGFIIMNSHFDDEKSFASLKVYLAKRFIRIFPPYWIISFILFLGYILIPQLSQGNRTNIGLISSLFLLPSDYPPLLIVAWTLIHEMIFYLIFCVYFISNRLFLALIITWIIAIVGANSLGITEKSQTFLYILNPINLEFICGMGVAYLVRFISSRYAIFILILSMVLFAIIWPYAVECRILFGLSFALMVLSVVLIEHEGNIHFPFWLILIGDASYSIYLIHNPIVSLTSRMVANFKDMIGWQLGLVAGVIASLAIGIAFHLLLEKPLLKILRKKLIRRNTKENQPVI